MKMYFTVLLTLSFLWGIALSRISFSPNIVFLIRTKFYSHKEMNIIHELTFFEISFLHLLLKLEVQLFIILKELL